MAHKESPIPREYKQKIPAATHWAGEALTQKDDFTFLENKVVGYRDPDSPETTIYTGTLATPQWENEPAQIPFWMKITDKTESDAPAITIAMPLSDPTNYIDIYRFQKNLMKEWKSWVKELITEGHDVDWNLHPGSEDEPYIFRNIAQIEWDNPITREDDGIPYLVYEFSEEIEDEEIEEEQDDDEEDDEEIEEQSETGTEETPDEEEEFVPWLSEEARDDTMNLMISAIQRTWRSASEFAKSFEEEWAPQLYSQLEEIPNYPITEFVSAFIRNPNITEAHGSWEIPLHGAISEGCSGKGMMRLGNSSVEISLDHSVGESFEGLTLEIYYTDHPFSDGTYWQFIDENGKQWKHIFENNAPFQKVQFTDFFAHQPIWQYIPGREMDISSPLFGSYLLGFAIHLHNENIQTLRSQGYSDQQIVDTLIESSKQCPTL
ncbi:MAG TPA: hypothetical protein VMR81_00020 [Patescibacteria group bacterium]|nr:hypothetical protein [Patescibacteria group bacterium]